MPNDASKLPREQLPTAVPPTAPPPHTSSRGQKLIFGGAVISATALTFQFGSPPAGGPVAPAPVNGLFLLILAGALIWHLKNSRVDEKIAISLVFSSILHLIVVGKVWLSPPAAELASLWAGSLSSTWMHVPWIGIGHCWALICLGWTCKRLLLVAGGDTTSIAQVSTTLTGFVTAALGVHALIGYVSGNPSLFAG